MASIIDVAKYILQQKGDVTAMKLQKLCYYCQAWTLVWDDVPLFSEDFEAWANGPVCPQLFALHRGEFVVTSSLLGYYVPGSLTDGQIENVDKILEDFWDYAPHQLSEMTHKELPWLEARAGLAPGERGHNIISKETMLEFYSGLLQGEYEQEAYSIN
jgi:uncharacterized phage-associated protein